jgi:hypothetical protein
MEYNIGPDASHSAELHNLKSFQSLENVRTAEDATLKQLGIGHEAITPI